MRHPLRALICVLLALWMAVPAVGQDRAGVFDHYLLALTWMPGFCRDEARPGDPRCTPDQGPGQDGGQGAGWGLHGLWPQHAGGTWPEFCPTPERAPTRAETAARADLFGTPGAAWHQWNKHGRCTGLSAADYYALSAVALGRVVLPDVVEAGGMTSPDAVTAAMVAANPWLTPAALVVTCRAGQLREVRLCLHRDLSPRACDAELRRCRAGRIGVR